MKEKRPQDSDELSEGGVAIQYFYPCLLLCPCPHCPITPDSLPHADMGLRISWVNSLRLYI
jgi:hypothetical protein